MRYITADFQRIPAWASQVFFFVFFEKYVCSHEGEAVKFSPRWKRAECTDVDDGSVKYTTVKDKPLQPGGGCNQSNFWLGNEISSHRLRRV